MVGNHGITESMKSATGIVFLALLLSLYYFESDVLILLEFHFNFMIAPVFSLLILYYSLLLLYYYSEFTSTL